MRRRAAERLLASNFSFWSWEYDRQNVYAKVYVDESSERLRLEIVTENIKTGLGAGTRSSTKEYNIGTLSRPKLGPVRSILKKHGAERSRAGKPFSPKWETPDGRKMALGAIIKEESAAAGPDPEAARKDLIRRIERMSPADLEKLYRMIPASERGRDMDRMQTAKRLVALAKAIVAEDGEEEAVDEQFASKIRGLRSQMNKLTSKKRKKLKQFGIGMLRPSATVEELVDALQAIVAE